MSHLWRRIMMLSHLGMRPAWENSFIWSGAWWYSSVTPPILQFIIALQHWDWGLGNYHPLLYILISFEGDDVVTPGGQDGGVRVTHPENFLSVPLTFFNPSCHSPNSIQFITALKLDSGIIWHPNIVWMIKFLQEQGHNTIKKYLNQWFSNCCKKSQWVLSNLMMMAVLGGCYLS